MVVVTIVAESVHMVRHGGLALPSVRGLGWSQRIARFVAAGLIVVVPTTHASRSQVHAVPNHARRTCRHRRGAVAPFSATPDDVPPSVGRASYTVRPGDSVLSDRATLDRG